MSTPVVPQSREEENQIHLAKFAAWVEIEDLHDFTWPAFNEPSILETCRLLKSLYRQFARLEVDVHSHKHAARKRLRRKLAPQLFLGLYHLLIEQRLRQDKTEHSEWFNSIQIEFLKYKNHEPTATLTFPHRKQLWGVSNELTENRMRQVKLWPLSLLLTSATIRLYAPRPHLNVEAVKKHDSNPEVQLKIAKKFWEGRKQYFASALAEWKLVNRFCCAYKRLNVDNDSNIATMENMVDIALVERWIKRIETDLLIIDMAQLDLAEY